jgi:hypothetical protein
MRLIRMKLHSFMVALAGLFLGCAGSLRAAESAPSPAFTEVFSVVRGALTNVSEAELNAAAIRGFITALNGQVTLGTNAAFGVTNAASVAKSAVFDLYYGYIRLGSVNAGSDAGFQTAYQALRSTNKLRGLVLDLRFADGNDYEAAAALADHFLTVETPLLKLSDRTISSKAKTNAVNVPVAVLMNRETSGAAEALGAMLREADAALLIGGKTAGRAHRFQEYKLSNSQVLRVARAPVELGSGRVLTSEGLSPDIVVAVKLDEEKAALEDPYRPRLLALKSGNTNTNSAGTNRFSRRNLNEAELVRRHREGLDIESLEGRTEELPPYLTDAALARSIDFLKGLAVAQRLKPR